MRFSENEIIGRDEAAYVPSRLMKRDEDGFESEQESLWAFHPENLHAALFYCALHLVVTIEDSVSKIARLPDVHDAFVLNKKVDARDIWKFSKIAQCDRSTRKMPKLDRGHLISECFDVLSGRLKSRKSSWSHTLSLVVLNQHRYMTGFANVFV